MACRRCQLKKKQDLVYVRSLATTTSVLREEDMQIYQIYIAGFGEIYDFEPINDSRTNIIEYIRYTK